MTRHILTASLAYAATASAAAILPRQLGGDATPTGCPGYSASNIQTTTTGLTADLSLAGEACNAYGTDIEELRLSVNYDAATRLHVKIEDAAGVAYQVPTSVFGTPDSSRSVAAEDSELEFRHEASPFSFSVVRRSNGEVLFDSSAAPLIFEDQYLRLRTSLPEDPNLYGLGEHSDSLRFNTTDYTRTIWSRDSYGIPSGTNLYGNHPIYFEHRGDAGTHGVFLLSSSGMDVKVNNTPEDGQYLEYNTMGGVIDLYIMAGPSPTEVSKQYAEVAGTPAMFPYWGLGLHQCRYGYRDFYAVAEVIYNYTAANIPLETMWTDIDYMYERYIMTTDPDRFTLARVRDIVNYLHEHNQHYIVMVDPAVAYQEEKYDNLTYDTFTSGRDEGIFLQKNGDIYQGVVWPGVTAFPDWFHPDTAEWWNNEFLTFFDADEGVDIDALWIDMNEAANFNLFGDDVEETAEERNMPPPRPALRSQPRPIPGFPEAFQPGAQDYPADSQAYAPPWLAADAAPNTKRDAVPAISSPIEKRQAADQELIGYPDRNFLAPPYQIDNENTYDEYGGLSNYTLDTDIIHYDGHVELDTHNLYGAMMSEFSRNAMEARRPGRRPLVITRSTFAGSGKTVGKWLGDNLSQWDQYRNSIQGMLNFASFFQMSMVGSDICGFGGNVTETLCARWATLGAFYPFMRNHNGDSSIPQEFFLWDTVADAARNALDIRYRLLDYLYTAMEQQSRDGTPTLNPLFFLYPSDPKTFGNELQFFFGDAILVSPVTEENKTSVDIYLPDDRFYDFYTHEVVEGAAGTVTLDNIGFDEIPLHIRGGCIVPMRAASGYTTTDVRKQPFHVVVALDRQGRAKGSLYLDDGDSIEQDATSRIEMEYADGELKITGSFGYTAEGNSISGITVLGGQGGGDGHGHDGGWGRGGHGRPSWSGHGGEWQECGDGEVRHDGKSGSVTVDVSHMLDGELRVRI